MKSSFFNGPVGPPPMRTSFRTARGFASGAVALCAVFFFLYAFKIYSIPSPDPEPLRDAVKPVSPLHSGLSDAPASDAWSITPWTPSSLKDTPAHAGLEQEKEPEKEPQKDSGKIDNLFDNDDEEPPKGENLLLSSSSSTSSTTSSSTSTSTSTSSTSLSPASLPSLFPTSADSSIYDYLATSTSISAAIPTSNSSSATDHTLATNTTISEDVENSGKTYQQPNNAEDYTTTIVVGRTDKGAEGVAWIKDELKDITNAAIYIVDDPEAELHLDRNKGREAMVYMKYIMEHYDKLSDITIFFHSGRMAWHNNILANKDGAVMVNNLRRQHVIDEGYFNMRCELHPGCPQWIKWNATKEENNLHAERFSDLFTVRNWDLMFPNRTHDPVYLAQPCCSQFALSREKIRSIPLEQYIRIHDFIAKSNVLDGFLGRIMEYVWQFLWLDKDEHCPSMTQCYCKGYGLCLEGDAGQDFVDWNTAKSKEEEYLNALGKYDRENCSVNEDPDEKKACKQANPFNKKIGDQRKLSSDLMAGLKKYVITTP